MPLPPLPALDAREKKTLTHTEADGVEWCERMGRALDQKKRRPDGGGGNAR